MTKLFYSGLALCMWMCQIDMLHAQQNGCQRVVQEQLDAITLALNNNNSARLNESISTIELTCGYTEFTQRLRILMGWIERKDVQHEVRRYTQRGFDQQLIDRYNAAAEPNFQRLFDENRSKYDYVPLNHAVDSLVKIKSAAIIGSDQFKLNKGEVSLAYLFSDHVQTYVNRREGVSRSDVRRPDRAYPARSRQGDGGFYLSGGVYGPINATSPVFNHNFIMGIGLMSSVDEDFVFDVYFKTRFNNNSRDFDYAFLDGDAVIHSKASYFLGGSIGYKFLDLDRFLSIIKIGAASERVSTNVSETSYDRWGYWTTTNTRKFHVRTYNLSAGLSLMQHVAGKSFVGLQGQYHYAPYNRDSNVLTPIASDYFSVELFFKF